VRTSALRLVEFVYWTGTSTLALLAVLGVLAIVFGSGLLTLKYLLFVVGFLLFGVGTFGMRAGLKRRPNRETPSNPYFESDQELDFETRIQAVPPLRDDPLPYQDRVSRNVKLFATGLVLLAISLLLEVVLGVQVAAPR